MSRKQSSLPPGFTLLDAGKGMGRESTTDAKGSFVFSQVARCAEPKAADWESFWASLTFERQGVRQ